MYSPTDPPTPGELGDATAGPARPRYDVALDRSSVKRHEAGHTPDGEPRTPYSVELTGTIDDRWRQCLRLVQLDDTGFFRFRLGMGSRAISFVCRTPGKAELASSLREIDRMLFLANRNASQAD